MSNVEYVPDSCKLTFTESTPPRSGMTVSGYGRNLPGRYMVQVDNEPPRRLRHICYGNASSAYIIRAGRMQFIADHRFP